MTWWVEPWGTGASFIVVVKGGAMGYGEATPLPGFAGDDLERARGDLEDLPAPCDDPDAIDGLLARFRSPSARFAVETALRDLIARRAGRPLLAARAERAARSILIGSLLDDAFLERARSAVTRGARGLKLKARGHDLGEETRRLAELRGAITETTRLRLDLNGSLDLEGARAALRAYAEHAVELCEEPCGGDALLSLGREATPWFADESALDPERLGRLLEHPGCAGLVLKPTLVGGISRTLERARAARARGKHAIVTHAFEGPVALAAHAALALVLGGELGHGLDRHAGLSGFPRLELDAVPERAPLEIVATSRAGLGVSVEGAWASA